MRAEEPNIWHLSLPRNGLQLQCRRPHKQSPMTYHTTSIGFQKPNWRSITNWLLRTGDCILVNNYWYCYNLRMQFTMKTKFRTIICQWFLRILTMVKHALPNPTVSCTMIKWVKMICGFSQCFIFPHSWGMHFGSKYVQETTNFTIKSRYVSQMHRLKQNDPKWVQKDNVNPGLINPGWVQYLWFPQIVTNGYWNGTPCWWDRDLSVLGFETVQLEILEPIHEPIKNHYQKMGRCYNPRRTTNLWMFAGTSGFSLKKVRWIWFQNMSDILTTDNSARGIPLSVSL